MHGHVRVLKKGTHAEYSKKKLKQGTHKGTHKGTQKRFSNGVLKRGTRTQGAQKGCSNGYSKTGTQKRSAQKGYSTRGTRQGVLDKGCSIRVLKTGTHEYSAERQNCLGFVRQNSRGVGGQCTAVWGTTEHGPCVVWPHISGTHGVQTQRVPSPAAPAGGSCAPLVSTVACAPA